MFVDVNVCVSVFTWMCVGLRGCVYVFQALCVYASVSACVCLYERVYVLACFSLCMCMSAGGFTCVCTCLLVCEWACVFVCVFFSSYMYVCECVFACLCAYLPAWVRGWLRVSFVRLCTCIYVRSDVWLYVCLLFKFYFLCEDQQCDFVHSKFVRSSKNLEK